MAEPAPSLIDIVGQHIEYIVALAIAVIAWVWRVATRFNKLDERLTALQEKVDKMATTIEAANAQQATTNATTATAIGTMHVRFEEYLKRDDERYRLGIQRSQHIDRELGALNKNFFALALAVRTGHAPELAVPDDGDGTHPG